MDDSEFGVITYRGFLMERQYVPCRRLATSLVVASVVYDFYAVVFHSCYSVMYCKDVSDIFLLVKS